jgi:hypothetical protein
MNPVPRIGEANMLFPFNQQYNLQLMKMLWHLVSLPMYYLQILWLRSAIDLFRLVQ